jgi:predicted phage tail protein
MAWWVALLISLAISTVAYLIAPKAKTDQPDSTTDMDDPTAEAGRPIPVLFGTMTISGLNILWYGEKRTTTYTVEGNGGKK